MIHYKPHITVYNELNTMSYNELNAMSSWPVFIKCVSCDKNKREKYILECSHCEREVCKREECCSIFPNANNKPDIVICKDCEIKIENKFRLIIDCNQLQLLKKKIKNNSTYHPKC